jgi:hypothetical protein
MHGLSHYSSNLPVASINYRERWVVSLPFHKLNRRDRDFSKTKAATRQPQSLGLSASFFSFRTCPHFCQHCASKGLSFSPPISDIHVKPPNFPKSFTDRASFWLPISLLPASHLFVILDPSNYFAMTDIMPMEAAKLLILPVRISKMNQQNSPYSDCYNSITH